jgi:transposase
MDLDLKNIPDDASLSKESVIDFIDVIEVKYDRKIHYLEKQLRLSRNELFGRKSERRHEPHPVQMPLFDKDEAQASDVFCSSDKTIVFSAHARKKRGRKSLPKDLQRVDNIHELSEEEKQLEFYSNKTVIVPTQSTN